MTRVAEDHADAVRDALALVRACLADDDEAFGAVAGNLSCARVTAEVLAGMAARLLEDRDGDDVLEALAGWQRSAGLG